MEFCAELMNVTPDASNIPGFASLSEFGMYTIASVEESYNAMMQEIGIQELHSVMEAEGQTKSLDIKKLIGKFVDWVKGIWEKFVGLVKKCRDYIITFIGEKAMAIAKPLAKVKPSDLVDAVKDSDDKNWENFKKYVHMNTNDLIKIIDAEEEMVQKCINYVSKAEEFDKDKFNNDVYSPIKKILDPISIDEVAQGSSRLKERIRARIIGETAYPDAGKAKEYAIKSIPTLYSIYKGGKVNVIKDFDNEVKKPYNELKKELDKAIRAARKAENGKELKPLFAAAKGASKVASVIVNTLADGRVAVSAYDLRIRAKSLSLVKKANNETKTNESADVASSTSFQSELGSLFNF